MNLSDIEGFIKSQREESTHLEYKASAALEKTDGKKAEISKDVSAFANSDGGMIIYGVKEYDDPEKKHLPERIDDGLNPAEISKEWLENVITSRIQPKINSLVIHPIPLATGKMIYAVEIPRSTTAHQASDHRYYKRHNFKAEPMEDYEVRDTMNRSQLPVLEPIFTTKLMDGATGQLHNYELRINLHNQGSRVIKDFLLIFGFPEAMMERRGAGIVTPYQNPLERIDVKKNGGSAKYLMLPYAKPDAETVIFPQQAFALIPSAPNRFCIFKVNDEVFDRFIEPGFDLIWRLYADDMPCKEGSIPLKQLSNF